jgi:hypothetical protein
MTKTKKTRIFWFNLVRLRAHRFRDEAWEPVETLLDAYGSPFERVPQREDG